MTDWSISSGIPPKFWFGCSVTFGSHRACIGTVYGYESFGKEYSFPKSLLEWRSSKEFILIPTGWYCRVRWSDGHEQVIHEKDLLKVLP